MKIKSTFAIVVGMAVAWQAASAANIVGTIILNGTAPQEIPIQALKDDPTCGPLHTEMPTTHHYVIGPKGEVANVVVMLKGITGKSTGASADPVVLDQKGCEYHPVIFAVQTGQKIIVRNSDPVLHNIHALPSPDSGNPEGNLPQMAGGPDLSFTFMKPENFLKFKCDVHPWMFAWVTVVDSPYFAVTDTNGKYTIKDVPPGKYTVVAMHRKLAAEGVEKDVEVKDSDVTADFTFQAPAPK